MLQKDLKVLLADDNKVNQIVLQKMLNKLGYHTDIASNGIEAVESFEHKDHDLILMDIMMPEMDGLEATKEIRKRWPHRDPKIIAVTAYSNCFDKDLCFEAGMDEYLSKPLKLEELQSAMSKVADDGIGSMTSHYKAKRLIRKAINVIENAQGITAESKRIRQQCRETRFENRNIRQSALLNTYSPQDPTILDTIP